MLTRAAALISALAACGQSSHGTNPDASRGSNATDASSGSGGSADAGVQVDAGTGSADGGTSLGMPMTCPGPGMPKPNTGSCGTERWAIKVGTDSAAPNISLVPQPNTIAALDALPAAGAGNSREMPTESTVYELKNVILTEVKLESDNDYHLVISDGTKTMIAEIPSPHCSSTSTWPCFISRARSEVDAKYNVTSSPQYPSTTITLRGVGFFDVLHGQTGVAPNGIELHPVLEICFGMNCTPD